MEIFTSTETTVGISDFSKMIGCSFSANDTLLENIIEIKLNLQINRRLRSNIDKYIHDPRVLNSELKTLEWISFITIA